LVDGSDLRAVLQAVPGGRLDWPVVVFVLAQLARGLNHAHRRILRGRPSPVVHRDMSPGNVVVDYDGNIKIVDFGIAKALAAPAERTESLKGKLSYMAPEQAMGGRTDGRADQYALGVIAYQALCGVRPNDGANDAETLACMLEGRHVPLRERDANLPPALVKCVERMLSVHPDDRYPNLDAVLDALAELTPKLTVYRELIPLVIAARQPHTIVRENGRFVSRPVEAAPALYAAQTPDVYPVQEAQTRRGQRMSSLAVTLGNTRQQLGGGAPAAPSASAAVASQPEPARVQPPALPTRQVTDAPALPSRSACLAYGSRRLAEAPCWRTPPWRRRGPRCSRGYCRSRTSRTPLAAASKRRVPSSIPPRRRRRLH
jgi:serine/threonine-protein kinase